MHTLLANESMLQKQTNLECIPAVSPVSAFSVSTRSPEESDRSGLVSSASSGLDSVDRSHESLREDSYGYAVAELAAVRAVATWVVAAEICCRFEAQARSDELKAAFLTLPVGNVTTTTSTTSTHRFEPPARPMVWQGLRKNPPVVRAGLGSGMRCNSRVKLGLGKSGGPMARDIAGVRSVSKCVARVAEGEECSDERFAKLQEWKRSGRLNATRAGSASAARERDVEVLAQTTLSRSCSSSTVRRRLTFDN